MNDLTRKSFFDTKQPFNALLTVILLLGTALRFFHFLYNRSLWMDETYLCSSLVHMNYGELATKALDYQQKAPIGFLWLVKLPINLFGNNEMVLRIIPLIAGIVSLFLFRGVCKYFLKPAGQLVALSLFAFAPALIYHSVEIKQYATECLATVIALHLFIRYKDSNEWKDRILWGIWGALTLWFSFSVIFVLGGIGTGISLYLILKKNWKSFFINAVPFSIWLISFIVNYALFTHKHAESQWVVYFFKVYDNFMPFPPHSVQQLKWFPRNFLEMMDYPLGVVWNLQGFVPGFIAKILSVPVLPSVLLFTGIFTLALNHKRNFFVLLFPVLFMLLASGLYLYPLLERFWVFIAPVFILFIATGFDEYQGKIKSARLIWVLPLLIIIGPVLLSASTVIHPEKFYKHKKSYERESLLYISNHFKQGDAVYNYWNNRPGYSVYKQIYNFNYQAIEGTDHRKTSKDLNDYNQHLQADFRQFAGKKRVWLIYNTQFLTDIGDKIDDPRWYYQDRWFPVDNLLREFNKLGKPIEKIVHPDVTVCLFELR